MFSEISGIPSSGAQPSAAASGNSISATKDQFLKLLLAQLKNQDPLAASDATEFTKQMLQFGQLEQLFNLNDSVGDLNENNNNMMRTQAVGIVGKQIDAKTENIEMTSTSIPQIGFSLDRPAGRVEVSVVDSLGRVVRTLRYDNLSAGSHYQDFDGLNSNGTRLSNGVYSLRLTGTGADLSNIPVTPISRGLVNGVDFTSGKPMLKMGSRLIKMEDLISVNLAS